MKLKNIYTMGTMQLNAYQTELNNELKAIEENPFGSPSEFENIQYMLDNIYETNEQRFYEMEQCRIDHEVVNQEQFENEWRGN